MSNKSLDVRAKQLLSIPSCQPVDTVIVQKKTARNQFPDSLLNSNGIEHYPVGETPTGSFVRRERLPTVPQ